MMPLNKTRVRKLLADFDFATLFVEELGWDRHQGAIEVTVGGQQVRLDAVAQKRGVVAYHCPTPDGAKLPEYALRRKIENQVAKVAHEHLIIFTDAKLTTQIWQWVRREAGKPAACREHAYTTTQPGDALLQKIEAIAFSLEEEETLTLIDVTRRARSGFDLERVTKKFYERFQKEHTAFLGFISGITEETDREWYASVMLNRLMFIYFIQRKGFLDGDRNYLRNRLERSRAEKGVDKFYSFYRFFLLRLFHEGLGGKARTPELEKLLGRIPYLNGGLFEEHIIEQFYPDIQIPDSIFDRIFNYFDQYQWHLDERPLKADDEINPDVLGYIFEKYINQKQMGAYYTKEDITEYIGKNTVIPFLFDTARAKCKVAFENPNGPTIWDLLRENPERYIYPSVGKGSSLELPEEIAKGVNPPTLHDLVVDGPVQTLELRKGWNKPAPSEYALPTETWREVVARRKLYEDVRRKMVAGEIKDISELVTLNLDIRQFAQDVIEHCEGPDLLRAFWHGVERITVLDPTCGSGAFLFAALNILEPLYEACLDRMEAFVVDLDHSEENHRPEKFSDFRKVLARVAAHPNRRYFIFKSIILNNLYGVDIMEEAVEICKLRLFLKLAAQVEPDATKANLGIEPLPDVDFNIKAGNTLVGYANLEEVKRAFAGKKGVAKGMLDFDDALGRITTRAADLQQTFEAFRQRQTEGDGSIPAKDKEELRRRLKDLEDELNRHLAKEYGVDPANRAAYEKWLISHQPFHWFVEFYGIMNKGGFDVIIGNPPYVEYKDVKDCYTVKNFQTIHCGDLYSFCTEKSLDLISHLGRIGLIVPISIFCTDGFSQLQQLVIDKLPLLWVSCFSNRPSQLFDGAQKRLTILIGKNGGTAEQQIQTTQYYRWKKDEFDHLFESRIHYATQKNIFSVFDSSMEKLGTNLEIDIFKKLITRQITLGDSMVHNTEDQIYYTRKFGYFLAFLDFIPKITDIKTGKRVLPTELKALNFKSKQQAREAISILSSSLFFWFYNVLSDCRNLNKRDLLAFPISPGNIKSGLSTQLEKLGGIYLSQLKSSSKIMVKSGLRLETFTYAEMKEVLDKIDVVLASHCGFTEEELDFIINYDIKYRMGREVEADEQ